MKKNFLQTYVKNISELSGREEYRKITAYFIPEFITAIVLYSLPLLIDARMIACLRSTQAYATLGVTNTIIHFIIKVAEGLSVGTIVTSGQLNGSGRFKEAGAMLVTAFWTTVLIGLAVGGTLFVAARSMYVWYGVPEQLVDLGIPFLQLRAVGVFFMFVCFAFVGFLRGIKNTRIPMAIFLSGSAIFVLFDYVLIFGKWGFPALGLQGSAWATLIQSAFMCCAALAYILFNSDMERYKVNFFGQFASWQDMKKLFELSWPVMIDKGALAGASLWLGKCIAPMGVSVIATFAAIKDLERFGLLPAIALAQVVTLMVSNETGKRNWEGIKITTKKILFLAIVMTSAVLLFCSVSPATIIRVFDSKGEFTDFAAKLFPFVSALALFDIIQLILAGALRGAANVKTVMWSRLMVFGFVFAPLSYFFSVTPLTNQFLKFMLIYGSLYVCSALTAVAYYGRFRGSQWIQQALRNSR